MLAKIGCVIVRVAQHVCLGLHGGVSKRVHLLIRPYTKQYTIYRLAVQLASTKGHNIYLPENENVYIGVLLR